MFQSLPHHFRKHKLAADVRTLILLRKSIEAGLVNTLGDLFLVLKGLIPKDPREFGPFSTAFYEYFLSVEIKKGERLESALLRSEVFQKWKDELPDSEQEDMTDLSSLIDQFLDEVHMTSLDIQKILDGEDILNQSDPDREDTTPEEETDPIESLDRAADYSNISTQELMERLRRIREKQKGKHSGGSHWMGSGGVSAFGNNGAAKDGIRMGGGGGGKMARAVIGNPQFYPVDTKVPLKDDNIDVALASLKGIEEEAAERMLDIPKTIKAGLKQGGIFLPYEKEVINPKVQVILLIDNGGLSMTPYVRTVQKLFSKMKRRFAHDLKTYYYHNTLYGGAYSDMHRKHFESIEKICKHDKNYSVFIIGDADMAPYELTQASIENWETLKAHFSRTVWLNPMNERYIAMSDTAPYLKRIFSMHTLTPYGISKAVEYMNRKRKYSKV